MAKFGHIPTAQWRDYCITHRRFFSNQAKAKVHLKLHGGKCKMDVRTQNTR